MPRFNRVLIWGTMVFTLLVLNACGSNQGSNGNNSNPGESSNGQVSIVTDHLRYTPTDSIAVTVTNHLQTSIFAYDTRASCSILGLQVQINGAWKDASVAQCPLGRPASRVEIGAGKTYSATISAGYPGISQATFPVGTYRLLLAYSTSATPEPREVTTTIYSLAFMVISTN